MWTFKRSLGVTDFIWRRKLACILPSISCPLSFTASLAKQFLCQLWVKPSGDQEKGSQFNSALHALLW